METSILLAKVFGIYLIVVPVAYFLNKSLLPGLISLFKSKVALFLSGLVALLLGVFIVLNHNVWTSDWRVIITLFGWAAILKGMLRVFLPDRAVSWMKKTQKQKWIKFIFPLSLILGVYLLFVGFTS